MRCSGIDIDSDENAQWYLTRLLCNDPRTGAFLCDSGTRSALVLLAEYYRQTLECATSHECKLLLQRLGDVTMAVSDLFSGALKRKAVGISYYIAMGEAAYSALDDVCPQTSRERTLQRIFEVFANDFNNHVMALSEVPVRPEKIKRSAGLIDDLHAHEDPVTACALRLRG